MYNIEISDEFIESFSKIIITNPYLKNKFKTIKNHLRVSGVKSSYDIKKLGYDYFRLKIPPFRIILKLEGNTIKIENIFKRKGKSDYKKFS